MARRQLLALAIGGESLLVVVALLWIWLRAIPVHATGGPWQRDAAMGVAAAGVLAVVNWALLCRAPDVSGVRGIRRLCWDMLRPLFAAVAPRDVVIIGVAAGVGEELLFRGALQPEAGLVAASVVFGLLHMGWAWHVRVRLLGNGDGRRARLARRLDGRTVGARCRTCRV